MACGRPLPRRWDGAYIGLHKENKNESCNSRRDGFGRYQECTLAQRADRFNVYSYDGRLIGRDPDANIRMQLRGDDAFLRSR